MRRRDVHAWSIATWSARTFYTYCLLVSGLRSAVAGRVKGVQASRGYTYWVQHMHNVSMRRFVRLG